MKDDVILVGPSEYRVARTVTLIGACTLPFSLLASLLVLRWYGRGKAGN